ncbi:3-dehydroquinate synthase [Sedimentibacter sp.]|uniref:3-dehydroquinate synthase n=1 Tax=Sedimentibacter sp. TaxID=1960295 RepID=UPI0028AFAF48|nr:3-dehydroquinate synthase [Sedimentibacter sp.]
MKLDINIEKNTMKYEVIIKKGLIQNLSEEIKKVYTGKKIAVLTDENIFELYGSKLESSLNVQFHVSFIVIKPGENSKTLSVLEFIYAKLSEYNIQRSDLIIAFGGGVVGDLTGFAASTYLRGIDYIQVPTSLIAQTDSCIGGKTAVNLTQGKNLAGSFYHPKAVLIDTDFLLTLSDKHIKDGMGEIIKYACIKDLSLFRILVNIKSQQDLFENIEEIVHICLSIKKQLIESDEKDNGMRMLLNFGHTIGHAIEKYSGFQIAHGEAVSAGMLIITKNSERIGYTEIGTYEKLKAVLDNFNIQYNLDDYNKEEIKKYILSDKKILNDNINLILMKTISESFIHNVPINVIDEFINP